MRIEEILARRSDLSTFLVHLTRDTGTNFAENNLKAILEDGYIKAFNAFGPGAKALAKKNLSTNSQMAVCFTETPLEHTSCMLEEIDDRNCQFKPYGIAITKSQGREGGANPVWYTDMTPSGRDWLMNSVNTLLDEASEQDDFSRSSILKLTPFIEQMGSGPNASRPGGYKKEFWWEREWRHKGKFELPSRILVLCPEEKIADFSRFTEDLGIYTSAKCVDPRWSLEKIIGTLAGFQPSDLGPF